MIKDWFLKNIYASIMKVTYSNLSHKLPEIDTLREFSYLPTYKELELFPLKIDISLGPLQLIKLSASH